MKRKVLSITLIIVLVLSSMCVAFAAEEIDYSQWDSQNRYPSDVRNTKYYTAVKTLVDKGAIEGYTDNLYYPEKTITRAEFSKIITIATKNNKNYDVEVKKDYFTDLSGYTWAKGYINCGYSTKIINGIGNSQFAPGKDVTYAEVITMLIRAKGDSPRSAAEMMGGTWPDNYIKYFQTYLNAGDADITDWNAPATRGDVALLLYRNLPK